MVVIAVTMVVSTASAWTGPTGVFPAGNVPAPINTGSIAQTKASSFSVVGGNLSASGNVNGTNGFFSALVNSAKGRFGCFLFCSDITSTDILKAGTYANADFSRGLVVASDGLVSTNKSPLWINISGNTGSAGRNALAIFPSSDNLTNGSGAVIQTSADKFAFWNIQGTDRVALSAKKIQLTEGAAVNSILAANDADGNAVWKSLDSTSTDGLITYRREDSSGSAMAVCNSDSIAISGGGDCEYGIKQSQPIIDVSGNVHGGGGTLSSIPAIGWKVACLTKTTGFAGTVGLGGNTGAAHAEVVCMKKTPLAIGLENNSTPTTYNWIDMSEEISSTSNGTCLSWARNRTGIQSLSASNLRAKIQNVSSGTSTYSAVANCVFVPNTATPTNPGNIADVYSTGPHNGYKPASEVSITDNGTSYTYITQYCTAPAGQSCQ